MGRRLTRLDICYNHHVGALLPNYLSALAILDYPRRKTTHTYRNESVIYQNTQANTKFYDKRAESKNPAASGILRQETTFRKNNVKMILG